MKIIQERKPYQDWFMNVTCNGKNWEQGDNVPCGSDLEIDKNDLLVRGWFKYPDMEGKNYGFICPICGCFTEIDESKLDKNLKKCATDYKSYINKCK